ncbi:ABC transporter permease [Natrarchaeobius oligotrophus]|uniref:ABC transporter permease n=1 Tax=Natrarchaeobius chitinivorans TaxID=1679083 RepID=A0A3N6NQ21_NATCH|nr:ABC transporter permease [Natrarchaeobius chitinivorans]RQH01873.1 ABC transporter permease [Natrarchaeobius chitinivorans]
MDVTYARDDVVTFTKSIYSLIIFLVLWEAVAQMGLVYYYYLPPLSDVLARFVELTLSGEIPYHSYLTLRRALVGLVIGTVFGILVGILIARNAVAEWFFDPIIKIGYPIPIIALVPVFMLWFGIGDQSKIIMVAIGTFWPIAVNARNSAQRIDKNYIRSARMMGTSDRRLLWRVVFPAASPGIVTGLQIALPLSLIITFVFEMVAGGGGLGALEIEGVRTFDPTQVYATIIAIMLIGIALDRALRLLRNHYLRWV